MSEIPEKQIKRLRSLINEAETSLAAVKELLISIIGDGETITVPRETIVSGPEGKVIEGMDVVNSIANVEVVTRDESASEGVDKPVNPPVITSIRVETYGVDYGEPETMEAFDYYNWIMSQYSTAE